MSERPRPPTRAYEIKTAVLGNFRQNRFEKSDKPRPPSWRSQRVGMDPKHLANIRTLECCGPCHERDCIHAHHLKSGAATRERGVGLRATDRWAVPLCWAHHDEIERIGSRNERAWFLAFGIDCHLLALALWGARGDPVRMDFVLREHKKQALRTMSAKRSLILDLETREWRRMP